MVFFVQIPMHVVVRQLLDCVGGNWLVANLPIYLSILEIVFIKNALHDFGLLVKGYDKCTDCFFISLWENNFS